MAAPASSSPHRGEVPSRSEGDEGAARVCAPYEARLTPAQRIEKAERFINDYAPDARLVSAGTEQAITHAVFDFDGLLVSFRWVESMGSLHFARSSDRPIYYAFEDLEIAFGWRAMPSNAQLLEYPTLNEIMERAGPRLRDLNGAFSTEEDRWTIARRVEAIAKDRELKLTEYFGQQRSDKILGRP